MLQTSTSPSDDALDQWLWPLLALHAPLRPPTLVPELAAFQADDELPLWLAVEAQLGRAVDAPFYAVCWPGAQALARAIFDGDVDVAGRRVVDMGCGSGLAAVAAAAAGADVVAVDPDPLALSATRALAAHHAVRVRTHCAALGGGHRLWTLGTDVVLVGDLVYNRTMGGILATDIRELRAAQPEVALVVADSGRPFFDPAGLSPRRDFLVAVPTGVEGTAQRRVVLYGDLGPGAGPRA